MKNYLEFNQTQAFFSGPFFEPAFGIAAGLMSFRRDKMWEPSSTLLVDDGCRFIEKQKRKPWKGTT
jgi:hypothetical protein